MANYTAATIDQWAAKMGKSMDEIARSVVVDLSAKIVARTPVDVGRLKGNWQATLHRPASGTTGRVDKSGRAVMAEVESVSVFAGGNVFYLTNNLPYARTAEYGLWGTGPGATVKTTRDGFSVQSPYGMVRITVQEFDQAVRAAVSRNR